MGDILQNLKFVIGAENAADDALEGARRAFHQKFGFEPGGVGFVSDLTKTALLGAAAAATGIGAALVAGVAVSAAFEQKMAGIRAITGATGADFDRLRDLAIQMGNQTKYSAQEAAGAIQLLAAAGLSTDEVIHALPGTLDLAAAGMLDLQTAANTAVSVMSGMGVGTPGLQHIVDGIAQAARAANTDVRGMGDAMTYVAPLAHTAGVDFDTTAAAIALLSNAGLQGSLAGTSLAAALREMVDPSNRAKAAARDLGVEFVDSRGKIRNFGDIIKELEEKNISAKDTFILFGAEGGRAISALVSQGSQRLGELQRSIESSAGVAKEMAEVQMNTLQGSWDNFTSSVETLAIKIGDPLLPRLRETVNWLTETVNAMGALGDTIPRTSEETVALGTNLHGVNEQTGQLTVTLQSNRGQMDLLQASTRGFASSAVDGTAQVQQLSMRVGSAQASVSTMTPALTGAQQAMKRVADESKTAAEHVKAAGDSVKKTGDESGTAGAKIRDILRPQVSILNGDFGAAKREAQETAEVLESLGATISDLDLSIPPPPPETFRTFASSLGAAFTEPAGKDVIQASLISAFTDISQGGSFESAIGAVAVSIGSAIGGPVGGAIASFVTRGLFAGSTLDKRLSGSSGELVEAIQLGGVGTLTTSGDSTIGKLRKDYRQARGTQQVGILNAFADELQDQIAGDLSDRDARFIAEKVLKEENYGAVGQQINNLVREALLREAVKGVREDLQGQRISAFEQGILAEAEAIVGGTAPSSPAPASPPAGASSADAVSVLTTAYVMAQAFSRSGLRSLGYNAVAAALPQIGAPLNTTLREGLLDLARGGTPDETPFRSLGVRIVAREGLYRVPGGEDQAQLAVIHGQERILNARQTRAMDAALGLGGEFEGAAGHTYVINCYVSALDGRDLEDFVDHRLGPILDRRGLRQGRRGKKTVMAGGILTPPRV